MNINNSVISNNNFFSLGLKKLLSSEFVNDFFTIIDLDDISEDDMKKIANRDKEVIAFASNDLSSLYANKFIKVPVLDKRCSLKDILSYFMMKDEKGIYRSNANLTKRETEIVTLLRNGLTHDEIAKKLNIADKTMYCHKRNLMKKLGCDNRINFQKMLLQTRESSSI